MDSGLRGLAFFGLLEDVAFAIDAPVDSLDASQIGKNFQVGDCLSLAKFESDSMRVEAAVFNQMQIRELSDTAKAPIPSIPWKQIYGLCNRIVHGCSGEDMYIVQDTVSEDIPRLHAELAAINQQNQKSGSSC